jgi:hypothetical protein
MHAFRCTRGVAESIGGVAPAMARSHKITDPLDIVDIKISYAKFCHIDAYGLPIYLEGW